MTRNCTGKPTGGPKLKRSTRTRASLRAPSVTAFSIFALMRSRASTSLATITISAKASFGSCGLKPPEAGRALADIGGVGRNILVVLEQRLGLLDGFFGDAERRPLGQPQLQEQFGPLRQRE